MNEYQWYHDPLPVTANTNYSQYSEEKRKKHFPVWAVSLTTSIITSAALIAVFSLFVLPHMRTPTTIHYSGTPDTQAPSDIPSTPGFSNSQISSLAEKCSPSTVFVSSAGIIGGFFNQQISLGDGSGIIISDDGYILTSTSVVNSGTDISVTLNNGQEFPAVVIGSDPNSDIAILKIEATGLVPAVLGNSQNVSVGDPILAIGSPLGPKITNTVTYGIISGINNNVSLQNGTTINLLLTDANISAGNAGGPLFNANGEVIGIVIANVSSDTNMTFSIPINDVKPILNSYLNTPEGENPSGSDTPMLGITATEESYGVVVETISEDSPAAKAGVKIGDIIIQADGTPVTTVAKINELRASHSRGDTMTLTVFREGETMELSVVLE